MLEPLEIIEKLSQIFTTQSLSGCHILMTAGPTQDPIDPVRYLSNRSSGKMGHALAQAAIEAGASVTMISGPVHLPAPPKVHRIQVKTANEMYQAVMAHVTNCDIFMGVAAVSDYTISAPSTEKIKKTTNHMTLQLSLNPDIIRQVAGLTPRPFVVGFAAETSDVLAKASAKRSDKNMDIIIANQVGNALGMESDNNAVTLIGDGWQESFPLMSKTTLARHIINCIAEHYRKERISINDKIDRLCSRENVL